MREIGVDITSPWVLHHGLGSGIDLTKNHLVAHVVVLRVHSSSGQVLTVDLNDVELVLIHTVRNHVLDEPIKGLNLLVNDTILLEISIDDFPLIVNTDLFFAIEVLNWVTANRRINLTRCSWSGVFSVGQIRVRNVGSLWGLQRSHNFLFL